MDDAQKESLVGFLKSYSEALTDDSLLKGYAPFRASLSMAGGQVLVSDKNGHVAACFICRHDCDGAELYYDPSTPVHPNQIAMAKLFQDCMNAVYGGND